MNAVDTNVLIYANDSRAPEKRSVAEKIISNLDEAILLWQVACEYVAASRKLEKFGFTQKDAFTDLVYLSRSWQIALPTWKIIENAEMLTDRYSISFWDATLVAACLTSGVDRLYSEDIGNHFHSHGLEIINPF